jgi:hypothetical protein
MVSRPDTRFVKAKLGSFDERPAVVLTDRAGQPFLWFTGETYPKAIKRAIAYCDDAIEEARSCPTP